MTCDTCGKPVYRTKYFASCGKFIGVDCGCCSLERAVLSVNGSFSDLTLEHIHDESGKPVHVTSLRQLREAEKRYHFSHRVANYDGENINIPEQQKVYTVKNRLEMFRGGMR